ncbi:MAG: pyridoxal-phosphate dependent enzyme [Acidobacteria bacterium]|nr:MAG: pyridoxal-phosphate dependent enzyme [Acidobacteriota bacterium]
MTSPALPLFDAFPALAGRLPHVPLGTFPTPFTPLRLPGLPDVQLKRDDLSGLVYGSNKVRKLEFLLGEARAAGASEVYTIGFAGSNHALATAIYARQLGLRCTSLLMPQHPHPTVRTHLLAALGIGATLQPVCCWTLALWDARMARRAYRIPPGGTSPLGVVAYVNAAFELAAQVHAGLLPAPDLLYVPFASMGTAAGLSIGLAACGLPTRIVAVRVIGRLLQPPSGLGRLLRGSLAYLRECDPSFPAPARLGENLEVRDNFLGRGYAIPSGEGREALALVCEACGVILSETYSAKAMAALLADARAGKLRGRNVLYWNTYNNRDLGPLVARANPDDLPRAFRRYPGA